MRSLRGIAVTLILVAIAAGLGAWGGATFVLRNHAQPSLHQFVHEGLSLTPDQGRRLDVIEREFAVRRQQREAELRQANRELAAAIQRQHTYSPEVRAAIDHFHHAMGELQKDTVLHILQMRAVLTPAQAEMFDRRVATALTQSDR